MVMRVCGGCARGQINAEAKKLARHAHTSRHKLLRATHHTRAIATAHALVAARCESASAAQRARSASGGCQNINQRSMPLTLEELQEIQAAALADDVRRIIF